MANTTAKGLSRDVVEELSRQKGEPEWMLQKRLHAWDVYEKTPVQLGRRGDLGTRRTLANFNLQALNPFVPSPVLDGNGNTSLSVAIEQSLKEALVDARSGLIVQRNSLTVRTELDEELKRKGVILTDLDTAVREHPELVQQYFMTTCVPVESNKYTALHAAFWSGGVFLYIPRGIETEKTTPAAMCIDSTA